MTSTQIDNSTAKINLKLLILWELSENSLTGYDIIKTIKDKGMKSPSPGSLYPILHDLYKDEMLNMTEEGKRKIYSLTKKGKAFLKKMNSLHTKSVSEMMSQLGRIAKGKELDYYEKLNRMSSEYKKEMFSDLDVIGPFQDIMLKVYDSKDVSLRKEMRKILKEATLKLKRKVD